MKSAFYPDIPAFPNIFIFYFGHGWVLELVVGVCVCSVESYADQPCQRIIATQIYCGNTTIIPGEAAWITIA